MLIAYLRLWVCYEHSFCLYIFALSTYTYKDTDVSLGRSVFSASVLSSMEENAMDRWHLAGSHPSNYESGIDPQITSHAKNCAYLKCLVEEPEGFATLLPIFKAAA